MSVKGGLLAALVLCGASWANTPHSILDQFPQIVQTQVGSNTCVFDNNVTSGNTIIIGGHSEGALTAPTDTLTTTWTLVDSNTGLNHGFAWVWIGVAGSSGAETITLTGSVSFPKSLCMELPPSIGSTVDVHGNGNSALTSFTTSTLTATTNGDFLFFYVGNDSSTTITVAGLPLVAMQNNGLDSEALGWGFADTNGTYSASFTTINGNSGYVSLALKPAAIIIDTASLPTGTITKSYSYCLQARGGAGTYTWSISSGALPTGLSINGSTGCISGTPTSGTKTPTFQVTEGSHTTTRALTLTVNNSATAPSFIQGITTTGVPATFTSVSTGDCLLVSAPFGASTHITPPVDSLNTNFKLITGSIAGTSTRTAVNYLYAGTAASSGVDTLTLADGYIAAQFSNCQVFGDASSVLTGLNVGVVTVTGAPIVTPAPNSMIWATYAGGAVGSTANAGSGYTADITGSNRQQGEHQSVSAAGSTPVTFAQTANTDGNWVITGLALRPSTSGLVAGTRYRAQIF